MRPRPSLRARRAPPRSGRSALAAPATRTLRRRRSATAAASPAIEPRRRHPSAPATPAAGGSNHIPPGWTEHDVTARNGVRRYLGNLVPMLGDIYRAGGRGQARRHPRRRGRLPGARAEAVVRPGPELVLTDALTPVKPEIDGDTKVFRLTIDEIEHPIDELKPTGHGTRLQRPVAGPDAPRQPRATRSARSSRTTSRRRPASTSTASSSTTSSWTASCS